MRRNAPCTAPVELKARQCHSPDVTFTARIANDANPDDRAKAPDDKAERAFMTPPSIHHNAPTPPGKGALTELNEASS